MSDRNFNNHPYNDERFRSRPRKGVSRGHHQRPSLNYIKDRVSQDIVRFARQRRGLIIAANEKNAIDKLAAKLRHSKHLIVAAFKNLVKNQIFRFNENEHAFVLMA